MKNYLQEGFVITVPAPGNVSSGDVVNVGSLIGFAVDDAASGETVAVACSGVFSVPVASADDVTIGAPLYWDGTEFTIDDTGNVYAGVAVKAAGVGVTSGEIRIR